MARYASDRRNICYQLISELIRHPAIPATVFMASGGIALMLANLLYAKLLEPEDFGRLVLVQTVAFVVMGLLPFGFDSLLIRKEIASPLPTVSSVLVIGLVLSSLLASLGHLILGVDTTSLLLIVATGIAGAATRFSAAFEQSELRFFRAQAISQIPLILFLAAAIYHSVIGFSSWQESGRAYALSYASAALFGWLIARVDRYESNQATPLRELWVRAIALIGILGSLLLLNQMERLLAAAFLGMRELGALGLATSLIASPFRILSAGVGYTLMPRLKTCTNRAERRHLLLHEFMIATVVGVSGAVLLIFLVPYLLDVMFSDRYEITMSLIVALVVLGLIRLNSGVFATAINAIADTDTLYRFNMIGWISAVLAAVSAYALSGFGSVGIVCGVSTGWLVRIVSAGVLIRKDI